MPCCDTGRNIQKYKGSGGTASTLQEALENSNVATIDINLISGAKFRGDGSALTGIPGTGGGVGNLQQVTNIDNQTTNSIIITNTGTSLQTSGTIISSGNITAPKFYGDGGTLSNITENKNFQEVTDLGATSSNKITLTNSVTSLQTSGNVVVTGNVTASKFYGDGTTLTGVALSIDLVSNSTRIGTVSTDLVSNSSRISTVSTDLVDNSTRISTVSTDLASNSTRITNLQNSTIISNSSSITNAFEKGDLIYASGQNTLSNLSIGSTTQVLTVSGSGIPVWAAPSGGGGGGGGGYWTQVVNDIYYTTGNVGIANTSPIHTLDIGSNVSIIDDGVDKLYIRGNVYSTHDIISLGTIYCTEIVAVNSRIKNSTVVTEAPTRQVRLI